MSWFDQPTPGEGELLVTFCDLTRYMHHCKETPDRAVLEQMAGFFSLTGAIIEKGGGLLVKAIGDAGLAAFPADHTDAGVHTLLSVRDEGEAWLKERGIPSRIIFKSHVGPVAYGPVGAPGRERFDIYGKTVNTAALLESKGFAMTPQVFRRLAPETRKLFKKHTPPITYIAADDRH